MPAATRKKQKTKTPVSAARRRESNMRPTVTHPHVPTLDQNNPEALFDVLTMKSSKKRFNTNSSNNITNDEDLERYVRDFPIDDSISQCFENNAAILDSSCMKKEQSMANRSESQEKLVSDTDSENTAGSSKKNFIGSFFGKKTKVKDRSDTSSRLTGAIPVKTNAFENAASKSEKLPAKSSLAHSKYTSSSNLGQEMKNVESCENEIEISPDFKTDDGNTLLHLAVLSSSCDATSRLLQQYPVLCDSKNKAGFTPIETAIQLGHVECMSTLLERQMSRTKDVAIWNKLLTQAIKNEQHECLVVLLQKLVKLGTLKHDAIDSEGNTHVHIAAQYGSITCLQVLAENGYDMFTKNKNGKSPLNVALEGSSFGCSNYLLALDMSKQLTELHFRNRQVRRNVDVRGFSSTLQQLHSQLKYVHSTFDEFFEEIGTIRENILKSLSIAESRIKADSVWSDKHHRLTTDLEASKNMLADLMEFSPIRTQQKTMNMISRELENICKSLPDENVNATPDKTVNFKDFYRSFVQRRREKTESRQSEEILQACIDDVYPSNDGIPRPLNSSNSSNPEKSTSDSFSSRKNSSTNIASRLLSNQVLPDSNNFQLVTKSSSGVKQIGPKSILTSVTDLESNDNHRGVLPTSEVPDLIYPTSSFKMGSNSITDNSLNRKNSLNSMQMKSFDRRQLPNSRKRGSSKRNSIGRSSNTSTNITESVDRIQTTNPCIPSAQHIKQLSTGGRLIQESEAPLFSCENIRGDRHSEHIQSVKRLVETQKQHPGITLTSSNEWRDESVMKEVCANNSNMKAQLPYSSKQQHLAVNTVFDTGGEDGIGISSSSNFETKTARDTNVSARDAIMKMFPERKAVNKNPCRLSKNCLARISPRCPPSEIRKEKAWYDASEDEESLYATYHSDSDKTLDDSVLFGPVDSV